MSVSDGQKANQTTFNNAFVSRTVDSNTVGKVDLNNTDAASGTQITNVQREHNSIASFTGKAVNQAQDAKPTWNSDAIGTPNQAVKDRVDSIQTAVEGKTDLVSPSTDNAIVRFDGTTGNQQNSGITIDDSNNMIVPGNLTVQGDTTIIGDTITTDPTITVNDTGNQAAADTAGAGIIVSMTDATNAALSYDSTLASKFKLGEIGGQKEIITATEIQTISGKTINFSDIDLTGTAGTSNRAVVSSDSTTNLTALARKKGAIYFDDTTNTYKGDDGTSLIDLGAGGTGVGGINYILNPDAEQSLDGWATYKDAAGTEPVDGTGGSPTAVTLNRETTLANVLRGEASFEIQKTAANGQGEGTSYDFTIDRADRGKPLYITFDYYNPAGTNFVSGDIKIFIYDVTNATLIPITEENDGGLLAVEPWGTRFAATFVADNNSISYRLIYHVATTNASAYTLRFDNVRVGPDNVVPGSIITEWESFTPTGSWTTNTTYSGIKRRNGSSMEVFFKVDLTGAPNAVALTFDVPDGLNIDSSRIPSAVADSTLRLVEGWGYARDNATADAGLKVFVNSADKIQPLRANVSATNIFYNSVTNTVPWTWAASDALTIYTKIPIDGWTPGASLSTTEVLFQTVKASANGDPASASAANPIIFPTVKWDNTNSYNNTTGRFTCPVSGYYRVHGAIQSANAGIFLDVYKNAVSDTFAGATDSNGEGAYSATILADAGDILDLRPNGVLDAANGSVINFERLPDFSTFSVWGETEYIEAKNATLSAWPITVNQYGDLTSINLGAGEWDISAVMQTRYSAATTADLLLLGISTTSGNSSTGLNEGDNLVSIFPDRAALGNRNVLTIPSYRVSHNSSTTYYLKARKDTSITNLTVAYRISARRIK